LLYTIRPLNEVGTEVGSIEVKKNKKILYYFANFAINRVNELLIIKNYRISLVYCLMQVRDEMGGRPAIEVHEKLFITNGNSYAQTARHIGLMF